MNWLEMIIGILRDYEYLRILIEEKCKVAAKINKRYYISDFLGFSFRLASFDSLSVSTVSDSFSFPLYWLTKSNEELAEIVAAEKKLKEEEYKKVADKFMESIRLNAEHNERMLYKKLKEKYEPKPINI